MRRLALVVVLLVGLLAAADRLGAFAAERVVAIRIQRDQSLAVRPDVTIRGFPFLTQLVDGHYDRVDVSVRDLRRGSLDINRVVAHLSGVDVPFSDVVRQHVNRVVVQHVTAEIDLNYADVDRLLSDKHLQLSQGSGTRVHVTASAGGSLHVDGDFAMKVEGSALVISLPAGASVQIPLPDLPFGIRLQSVRALGGGIVVRCSATGFVLRA